MADAPERCSAVFARKVRQLRTDRKWSQAELGRQLDAAGQGLKQSRIAAIEQTGHVTLDQAQAFADALSVPIELLIYDEPPSAVAIRQIRASRVKFAIEVLQYELDPLRTAD